ncbi:F-box only protein 21 [Plakobranchus ocellatus]|uniref:F-box only protein 21 n=1 Tax=Plakobranchus ocellatus TaxID=259542 RepID=A0AAV4DFC5_9GAST|nr:F-box only protein 21 [Plakobranchus ocellatus]
MPLALPDLEIRSGLLFLVLVLAIPIQYYLSNQSAVPAAQRQAIFQSLVHSAQSLQAKYLSVKSWQKWCVNLIKRVDGWRTGTPYYTSDGHDDDRGESPAVEVFHYRDPEGYFAASTLIRSPRPEHVKFRVGQVVQNKLRGYKGVIIGWDPVAHAPEEWLEENHPPEKWHWRRMPNYAILVDSRDRPGKQITYVPQENIEVISNFEIQNPDVYEYFDSFDGTLYIMRPAIKLLYPHD